MSHFSFVLWFFPVRAACHANCDGLIRNFYCFKYPAFILSSVFPTPLPLLQLVRRYPGFSYHRCCCLQNEVFPARCVLFTTLPCTLKVREGESGRVWVSAAPSHKAHLVSSSMSHYCSCSAFAGMLITSAPHANVCTAHMFRGGGNACSHCQRRSEHTSDVCLHRSNLLFFLLVPWHLLLCRSRSSQWTEVLPQCCSDS